MITYGRWSDATTGPSDETTNSNEAVSPAFSVRFESSPNRIEYVSLHLLLSWTRQASGAGDSMRTWGPFAPDGYSTNAVLPFATTMPFSGLPKTPDLPSSAQGLPSTSDDGMLAEQPRLIVSMSLRGVTEKTTLALPPSS